MGPSGPQGPTGPMGGGVSYVRWGRTDCPGMLLMCCFTLKILSHDIGVDCLMNLKPVAIYAAELGDSRTCSNTQHSYFHSLQCVDTF